MLPDQLRDVVFLTEMHEVNITYKRPVLDEMPLANSSSKADKILRSVIDLDRIDHKEFFWILLLSNNNNVLGISQISEGTATSTMVNLREIIQLCILSNAVGLIIAHNHPSGTLKASKSDVNLTEKIKTATLLFDVKLLDHLIITSEGYYSFADDGNL